MVAMQEAVVVEVVLSAHVVEVVPLVVLMVVLEPSEDVVVDVV